MANDHVLMQYMSNVCTFKRILLKDVLLAERGGPASVAHSRSLQAETAAVRLQAQVAGRPLSFLASYQ